MFAVVLYIYIALLWIGVVRWFGHVRGVPPPRPEIEYGAPPWWSFDAQWLLPEYEEDPDESGTDSGPP